MLTPEQDAIAADILWQAQQAKYGGGGALKALRAAGYEITKPVTDKDALTRRSDQIRMLQAVVRKADTGVWDGFFTYPNCGGDLVLLGLANEDTSPTVAGRAALFLIGATPDFKPPRKEP